MKIKKFNDINENYAKKQLDEIYSKNGKIKQIIDSIKKIDDISNADFDYMEERELQKAIEIEKILKK
jgi:hypothetical protein